MGAASPEIQSERASGVLWGRLLPKYFITTGWLRCGTLLIRYLRNYIPLPLILTLPGHSSQDD